MGQYEKLLFALMSGAKDRNFQFRSAADPRSARLRLPGPRRSFHLHAKRHRGDHQHSAGRHLYCGDPGAVRMHGRRQDHDRGAAQRPDRSAGMDRDRTGVGTGDSRAEGPSAIRINRQKSKHSADRGRVLAYKRKTRQSHDCRVSFGRG